MDKFSLDVTHDEAEEHIELRPKNLQTKFISLISNVLVYLPPFSLAIGVLSDYLTDFVKPHLPFQVSYLT